MADKQETRRGCPANAGVAGLRQTERSSVCNRAGRRRDDR